MGEPLRSSPLVEALCEFKFASLRDREWDLTIPGRLYERIGNEFSIRSSVTQTNIKVQPISNDPDSLQVKNVIEQSQRSQLKRSDGSAMVQVGPNSLIINHLKPYQTWDVFCSLILRIFSEYTQILESYILDRIGLRYINNIPFPKEDLEIGDYLTVRPNLEGSLDQPLTFFHQRYDLYYAELASFLTHQTATIQNSNNENRIVLDLDFYSEKVGSFTDRDEVEEWLNNAHDCIDSAFVSSLNTDFYEALK